MWTYFWALFYFFFFVYLFQCHTNSSIITLFYNKCSHHVLKSILFSTNEDSFTFSFQIWMCFIFFSCLVTLTSTSHTVLSRSGESRYSFLVSALRRKAFTSLLPGSVNSAIGFYVAVLDQVEELPFYFLFLRIFIINGSWHLSNAFSAPTSMIRWFFPFIIVI